MPFALLEKHHTQLERISRLTLNPAGDILAATRVHPDEVPESKPLMS